MADNEMKYVIRLDFQTDVKNATRDMDKLQAKFAEFGRTPIKPDLGLDKANTDILKIKQLLASSFNLDTGKLNLNKFIAQAKIYGMNMKEVRDTVGKFDPSALEELDKIIANGSTNLGYMSDSLKKFGEQLLRTTRIQLSYTILNQITSVFKNAYSYAQDLDKSLNNIRIVTGKSSDEMRAFAVEANKAAKSLSVSTTAYTDASLIYYQQGLDSKQVSERTEATLKLSNITGQSAEEVSSQMTAIWNNFDDGTKKLEYYADAITALGAATASSSKEIADGLQQFSAVADTVGLSYEYATAALATVVAQTRQSADTVGNSFKTIFARLESLKLGETLDDETTLTKYTQALETAGVHVKDQNGQLRDMDSILNDLGAKWDVLDKQQKNALAYTVAGARQYTNFIALMDNWGKVLDNVDIASNSSGTLQQQQDIYAESWEAANKRLLASWQELYDKLVDEDFFILITNGANAAVKAISFVVDALGGLKGIIPLLVSGFGQLFSTEITDKIEKGLVTVLSFKNRFTGEGEKAAADSTEALNNRAANQDASKGGEYSSAQAASLAYQQDFIKNEGQMTETERLINKALLDRNKLLQEAADIANESALNTQETYQQIQADMKLMQQNFDISDKLEFLASSGQKKYKVSTLQKLDADYGMPDLANIIEQSGKSSNQYISDPALVDKIQNALVTQSIEYANAGIKISNNISKIVTKQESAKAEAIAEKKVKQEKAKSKQENTSTQSNGEVAQMNPQTATTFEKNYSETNAAINAEEKLIKVKEELAETQDKVTESADQSIKSAEKENQVRLDGIRTTQELISAISGIMAVTSSLEGLTNSIAENGAQWSDLGRIVGLTTSIMMTSNAINRATDKGLSKLIIKLAAAATNNKSEAVATAENTLETKGLTAALGKLGITFGQLAIGIGAALVVLYGLVYVFGKIKAEIERPKKELEGLKSVTESAKDAANQAANAYDNLKNSLNNIDSKKAALSKMSSGTEEWKDQVNELDEAYLKLIDDYGLMYGQDYTMSKDGHIQLINEEETRKRILQEQVDKRTKASALSTMANNDAQKREAQNQLDSLNSSEFQTILTTLQKFMSLTDTVVTNISKANTSQERREILENLAQSDTTSEGLKNEISQLINTLSANEIKRNSLQEQVNQSDYSLLARASVSEGGVFEGQDANFIAQAYSQLFDNTENRNAILKQSGQSLDMETAKASYAETAQLTYEDGQFKDANKNVVKIPQETIESWALYDQVISQSEATIERLSSSVKEMPSLDWSQSDDELNTQMAALEVNEDMVDVYVELLEAECGVIDANADIDKQYKSLALKQISMNKGLENLSSSWDKHSEALKTSGKDFDKTSEDYVAGLAAMRQNLREVFEVDVSANFINDHLEDIQKLAEGDMSVLEELGAAAAKDYVANLDVNTEWTDPKTGEKHEWDATTIRDSLTEIIDNLSAELPNLEMGAELDDNEYINKLNEMLEKGQITADQANKILGSIGYDADIETKTEEVTQKSKIHWEDDKGGTYDGTITTTTDMQIPVIKSVRDAGGAEGVSAANKVGGSKTSKSSGGGGGSQKADKNAKDETERYHVIKNKIDAVTTSLDKLGKAKDRAFGSNQIKYLKQEADALEHMIELNDKYIKEIQDYAKTDRAAVEKYGAIIDENGIITNYDQLYAEQIEKFNKSAKDDAAEETYKQFVDDIKQWEDTNKTLIEALQTRQDNIYKKIDTEMQMLQVEIEVKAKIDETQLKRLEFSLSLLTDTFTDAAEMINNNIQKINTLSQSSENSLNGIKGLFGKIETKDHTQQELFDAYSNGTLDMGLVWNLLSNSNVNQNDWISQFEELTNTVVDNTQAINEAKQDYINTMQQWLDDVTEKFDDLAEGLKHYSEGVEHFNSLIDIIGQDRLGISDETRLQLAQTQSDLAIGVAGSAYEKYQTVKQIYEEAVANGLDEQVIKSYKEKMLEVQSELWSAQEEAAQKFQEQYELAVSNVMKKWEEGIAGSAKTLERLADNFGKSQNLRKLYMDTYEQAYNLNKLTNDINKSMNDTNIIHNKQELATLMERINEAQASGAKMSQYEYQAYQKEYELLLAKAALEDAQNAKSQVRMQRDNEGNMNYVYTADRDAIDKAQGAYDDAAYSFAQLNVGRIDEAQGQIVALYQQMEQDLANIDKDDVERREEVIAYYKKQIDYWTDQMGIAFDWNKELTQQTGLDYWDLADDFSDTVLSHETGYATLEDLQTSFVESTGDMITNLEEIEKNHKDEIESLLTATGSSIESFSSDVQQYMSDAADEIGTVKTETENLKKAVEEYLPQIINYATNFESKWADMTKQWNTKTQSMINKLQELLNKAAEVNNTKITGPEEPTPTTPIEPVDKKGDGDGTRGNNDDETTVTPKNPVTPKENSSVGVMADSLGFKATEHVAGGTIVSDDLSYKSSNTSSNKPQSQKKWHYNGDDYSTKDEALEAMKQHDPVNYWLGFHQAIKYYDTGGYTGQWGSNEGRLAVLHEKELVLNKDDTDNMFKMVQLARETYKNLTIHQYENNLALPKLAETLSANNSMAQNVVINADFPAVTDRYEIQAAFADILERASQYINRK